MNTISCVHTSYSIQKLYNILGSFHKEVIDIQHLTIYKAKIQIQT